MTTTRDPHSVGIAQALLAYLIWGFFPVYFWLVRPSGTLEVIGWRVVLSVVFSVVLIVVMRQWSKFIAVWRQPRLVGVLAVAGFFVMVNWTLYVWAVELGRPIEAALGYYLNPLISILLGMMFLRERLRPLQWVAVGLALAAVLVMILGYGEVPWLALALAVTFGIYGLVKKQVRVDAVVGFTVETITMAPVAVLFFVLAIAGPGLTMGQISGWHTTVLLFAGVITSLPLLLFAASSKKLQLAEIGILQYITPTMHFVVGLLLFREAMPLERWAGFALVWLALILFTIDLVRHSRRRPLEK
ncbi:EamA family transporter RarD [Gulosibacter macacae]|uniref:EamA family transporter RarD n=1 Tax=Gulosibacter macacae TaxID=2488791 RepID=A0A3P3VZB5_9MICO|nr:EamA family transporter RarD [Gulosibacter macacae]RRJ87577.1 EamA family transporter RarD [Gulosibacter macacae]